MGPPRYFMLVSGIALTGCIPASTAPAPRPAPPQSTSYPAAPDYERQTVEVIGGDAQPTWTLQPVATNVQVTATSYTARPGDMTGADSEAIATPAVFTGRFVWPLSGRIINKFVPLAPGKVNDGINIDVIGLSGASGQVQTPQFHFQLRKNRAPVDPLKQLPA